MKGQWSITEATQKSLRRQWLSDQSAGIYSWEYMNSLVQMPLSSWDFSAITKWSKIIHMPQPQLHYFWVKKALRKQLGANGSHYKQLSAPRWVELSKRSVKQLTGAIGKKKKVNHGRFWEIILMDTMFGTEGQNYISIMTEFNHILV